jgi:uncharacterized protein with ParB-like and HNH nuclease domain
MESNHNTPALFDVVKQFDLIKVDDYQRTYAWTRDEIQELFDDLIDTVDTGEFHFFGTLIFQSEGNHLATVVDGQQRLTTVFVLMAALRDEITRIGIDTLPSNPNRRLPIPVVNKVWEFLYFGLDPEKPRFKSNRFIEETLIKSVYAFPDQQQPIRDRDSELTLKFRKAVKEVRKLLREDLEKHPSQEEKLERVNNLIDAVRERFLVLRVLTASLNESLEIFLTLNNRGLPLGPSDLVRGEIISRMSHAESESAQARLHQQIFEEWAEIADNVVEVEAFLRHYLVSTGKTKVQKKKVFEQVSLRLRDTDPDGRKLKAKALWSDLRDASILYSQILNPTMGGDIQYQLEILHGLMKSHRILLLQVMRAQLDSNVLEKIVRQVYILCVRWNIVGGNAQKLEDLFQKLGNEFAEFGNVETLLSALKTEANNLSVATINTYLREDADEGYLGKAILHGINRARTRGANQIDLNSKIHLEHIAPQTPTDAWKADLFSGDERLYQAYESTIQQIGNLTLLDFKLNMSAKQDTFDKKRPKYDVSVIKLTDDLTAVMQWTTLEVERRTDYLIEAFHKVFAVDPVDVNIVEFALWKPSA